MSGGCAPVLLLIFDRNAFPGSRIRSCHLCTVSAPSLVARARSACFKLEHRGQRIYFAMRAGGEARRSHGTRSRHGSTGEQFALARSARRCSARALYTGVHRGETVGMLPLHQIYPIPGRARVSGRVRVCWRHQSERERDLPKEKNRN